MGYRPKLSDGAHDEIKKAKNRYIKLEADGKVSDLTKRVMRNGNETINTSIIIQRALEEFNLEAYFSEEKN